MGEFQLVMPKMGESVIEATILTWHKKPGDTIYENEIVLEVATDKVDSEVPSPVSGVLKSIVQQEGDVVPVGNLLAIIEVEGEVAQQVKVKTAEVIVEAPVAPEPTVVQQAPAPEIPQEVIKEVAAFVTPTTPPTQFPTSPVSGNSQSGYFSPLVLSIAAAEGISMTELQQISGSGLEGRITKEDVLTYVEKKKRGEVAAPISAPAQAAVQSPSVSSSTHVVKGNVEIIEMDRMRKLIAKNMVDSKRIAAHVSSFVEVDMTPVVLWREKIKDSFKKKEGFNITYMAVFVEAIVKAIKDFPMINVSVDGDKILKKRDINIGIATALPNGNLIVPVIKNADRMNLSGIAAAIHQLADKARKNQLSATDIEGGTYTISNIGTFGNILGTPIIPQPQVAIMAVGSITKKPVVLETPQGDVIAIRQMMYLSHTYDHRVVDGMLGGMFVKRVAEYLEAFDEHTAL